MSSISVRGNTFAKLKLYARGARVSTGELLGSLPLPTPEQVEEIRARVEGPRVIDAKAIEREIRAGNETLQTIAHRHRVPLARVERIAKRKGLSRRSVP